MLVVLLLTLVFIVYPPAICFLIVKIQQYKYKIQQIENEATKADIRIELLEEQVNELIGNEIYEPTDKAKYSLLVNTVFLIDELGKKVKDIKGWDKLSPEEKRSKVE